MFNKDTVFTIRSTHEFGRSVLNITAERTIENKLYQARVYLETAEAVDVPGTLLRTLGMMDEWLNQYISELKTSS